MISAPLGDKSRLVTADRRAVDAEVFGQLRFQPAGERTPEQKKAISDQFLDRFAPLPGPHLPLSVDSSAAAGAMVHDVLALIIAPSHDLNVAHL